MKYYSTNVPALICSLNNEVASVKIRVAEVQTDFT